MKPPRIPHPHTWATEDAKGLVGPSPLQILSKPSDTFPALSHVTCIVGKLYLIGLFSNNGNICRATTFIIRNFPSNNHVVKYLLSTIRVFQLEMDNSGSTQFLKKKYAGSCLVLRDSSLQIFNSEILKLICLRKWLPPSFFPVFHNSFPPTRQYKGKPAPVYIVHCHRVLYLYWAKKGTI